MIYNNNNLVDDQEDPLDPQPLEEEFYYALVPNNFKLSFLTIFNGKSDPQKYIVSIKMKMTINGATNFFKCN